jgi:hypothetical protein
MWNYCSRTNGRKIRSRTEVPRADSFKLFQSYSRVLTIPKGVEEYGNRYGKYRKTGKELRGSTQSETIIGEIFW